MSLQTLPKVRKLQAALHAKAKGAPSYRFYALYDKVYRADVLAEAYRRCRANGGAAGVDGQRFEEIEADGLEKWLGELRTSRRWIHRPVLSGRMGGSLSLVCVRYAKIMSDLPLVRPILMAADSAR